MTVIRKGLAFFRSSFYLYTFEVYEIKLIVLNLKYWVVDICYYVNVTQFVVSFGAQCGITGIMYVFSSSLIAFFR